jgi:hypothetical protein
MNKSLIIALVIVTLAVGMIASTIGSNTALAQFESNHNHGHGPHWCV